MSGEEGDNKGEWLFSRLQEQLRHEWEEYKEIHANSKGGTYEESLAEFLRSYFGGVYDVRTRAAVIDPQKRAFELFRFRQGDDELDVIAAFSNATPRILFEAGPKGGQLSWLPYQSAAFVCEVKSQLTKEALENDLGKLEKLAGLDETIEGRFGATISGSLTVDYPLRCLVYADASIADDTLQELLQENKGYWDLLLIVETDALLINRNLPFAEAIVPEEPTIPKGQIVTVEHGLTWFLVALSLSIPKPLAVNTASTIEALSSNSSLITEASTGL